MPRYVKDLPLAMSPEQAGGVISSYLQGQGFSFITEKTENVWKKGGALAIPQFVRAEPAEGRVHIEAWVAALSIIPGVYTGEQGLEGAWGFAIKGMLKKTLAELEDRLGQGVAPGVFAPPADPPQE